MSEAEKFSLVISMLTPISLMANDHCTSTANVSVKHEIMLLHTHLPVNELPRRFRYWSCPKLPQLGGNWPANSLQLAVMDLSCTDDTHTHRHRDAGAARDLFERAFC